MTVLGGFLDGFFPKKPEVIPPTPVRQLQAGDVVKINGELKEILAIRPHQEIPGAVYYDFGDGYEERDIRLHPEAIYHKVS